MVVKVRDRRFHKQVEAITCSSGLPHPEGDAIAKSLTVITATDTRSGDGLPGYRYTIEHGHNATTSFSATRTRYEFVRGQIGFHREWTAALAQGSPKPHWHLEERGDLAPFVSPGTMDIPTDDASVSNQAATRFIKRAQEAISAMQGPTFLGEIRETLHMLRRPAKALRSGLDSYLGKLRKVRQRTPPSKRGSVAGQTWLEYSYGWAPLIHDIRDANEALRRKREFAYQQVRGYAEKEFSPVETFATHGTASSYTLQWRTLRKKKVSYRYLGAVSVYIGNPVYMRAQLLGFDWVNFVPTVWELIPYSFLVDYFSNIGDVLTAWSLPSSRLNWGCSTARYSHFFNCVGHNLVFSTPTFPYQKEISQWTTIGSSKGEVSSVIRAPMHEMPGVHFELKIPGIGGFDNLRWLNMAALASTHQSLIKF